MTSNLLNLDDIKPIEGFRVLEWKQEVQEQIYREIEGMSTEELLEYFHQGSERFWAEADRRRTEISEQCTDTIRRF